jgi:hypothetical protein
VVYHLGSATSRSLSRPATASPSSSRITRPASCSRSCPSSSASRRECSFRQIARDSFASYPGRSPRSSRRGRDYSAPGAPRSASARSATATSPESSTRRPPGGTPPSDGSRPGSGREGDPNHRTSHRRACRLPRHAIT